MLTFPKEKNKSDEPVTQESHQKHPFAHLGSQYHTTHPRPGQLHQQTSGLYDYRDREQIERFWAAVNNTNPAPTRRMGPGTYQPVLKTSSGAAFKNPIQLCLTVICGDPMNPVLLKFSAATTHTPLSIPPQKMLYNAQELEEDDQRDFTIAVLEIATIQLQWQRDFAKLWEELGKEPRTDDLNTPTCDLILAGIAVDVAWEDTLTYCRLEALAALAIAICIDPTPPEEDKDRLPYLIPVDFDLVDLMGLTVEVACHRSQTPTSGTSD
ncbi:hypothetical protein C8J57DRAFT_1252515 [Mycena rebaudengoi]|nr:hypothetical protein C8J57DRAFT_1252515 [Mycena rebaudengoi]